MRPAIDMQGVHSTMDNVANATTTESTRRRGRPYAAWDPDQRKLHIECALRRLVLKRPLKETAHTLGISPRTVQLWTNAAVAYQDPEADILRRMIPNN